MAGTRKLGKVLIANRGEIACRIIRTARRMGLATVAVYSDADRMALHVAQADEAIHIGGAPASDSYLRIDKIMAAAERTRADCVHPGYGFLAENADFAEAVLKAGLAFIGPTPDAMRSMGGKADAKAIAAAAGVPVVPGYNGASQDARTLAREARKIGLPVLIKAVAGGGGRGMRLVERADEFESALHSARREAEAAFGDGRVLLEKLIVMPRHVEVQVFGDSHGNVVHLYERDCSLQRRNQKVIEEAPAPGMSDGLRAKITAAAVSCARAVRYEGAGTVEFLVEGGALGEHAPWYFIEMNTRLQVEHPVTEAVTGLDLVEWQLRVAAGEPLPLQQHQISLRGHAIEARLCAEDPAHGFMPSIGRIVRFEPGLPEAIRLETGVTTGAEVTPYYDSMIAKLIAHANTREAAIEMLRDGLSRPLVFGLQTNAAFLHALLSHAEVASGGMDTGLIGRELAALTAVAGDPRVVAEAVFALLQHRQIFCSRDTATDSPWSIADGFQLGEERRQTLPVLVDGVAETIDIRWSGGRSVVHVKGTRADTVPAAYVVGDESVHAFDCMRTLQVAWPKYDSETGTFGDADPSRVVAPITGKVVKLLVAEGASIEKGARIAVVEAMKMEHVLVAARSGKLETLAVQEGQQVAQGTLIASIGDD